MTCDILQNIQQNHFWCKIIQNALPPCRNDNSMLNIISLLEYPSKSNIFCYFSVKYNIKYFFKNVTIYNSCNK